MEKSDSLTYQETNPPARLAHVLHTRAPTHSLLHICTSQRLPNGIFAVQKRWELHKMAIMEWHGRKGGGVSVLEGNKEWIAKSSANISKLEMSPLYMPIF